MGITDVGGSEAVITETLIIVGRWKFISVECTTLYSLHQSNIKFKVTIEFESNYKLNILREQSP